MKRCGWVTDDPLYLAYHDNEWGIPVYDERQLFEMLCLEGQQAGLSWITVLKKRENYRHSFQQFDYQTISQYGEAEIAAHMQDAGLIRNRRKLDAIITNARALLAMHQQSETLGHLVWSQVDNLPQVNNPQTLADIPALTPAAQALSKALKKRGFKFIGPTICYAFMQACGLVNDHLIDCCCHPRNRVD